MFQIPKPKERSNDVTGMSRDLIIPCRGSLHLERMRDAREGWVARRYEHGCTVEFGACDEMLRLGSLIRGQIGKCSRHDRAGSPNMIGWAANFTLEQAVHRRALEAIHAELELWMGATEGAGEFVQMRWPNTGVEREGV
ncbi:hypothetical protein GOBAR_AA20456 [Gossypium barbadense]|uniref:Uncharacterized protein n=1 Tax=Gossypium barbadense TaxID=3634 RepID=A0A2P5XA49_GOSBA|nr:hypothetical protein GOBAR_AA20456 [Gossypium barbadense]